MKRILTIVALALSLSILNADEIEEISKENAPMEDFTDSDDKIVVKEVKSFKKKGKSEGEIEGKWFIINYQSVPKDIKHIN